VYSSVGTTLVLGVGNLLMSDEGVGVHVVQHLTQNYELPEEVQLLDGGTLGLDLLYYLEGKRNVLIIDAVDGVGDPGELLRLEGDLVPSFLSIKMSPHQIGIPDMLFAAKLKDLFPENLVLWGIQPASLAIGTELSPLIASKLETLLQGIIADLEGWGLPVAARF
jgi:hydrogenase maturation protease